MDVWRIGGGGVRGSLLLSLACERSNPEVNYGVSCVCATIRQSLVAEGTYETAIPYRSQTVPAPPLFIQ